MFKVEVHKINNATPAQRGKFLEAAEDLSQVINSPEFWAKIKVRWYDMTHKGVFEAPLGFQKFREYILSGQDNFNKSIDNDLDVYVTFYYSFWSVVGYTKPSTWLTWINRKMFKRMDTAEIAGNIFHEALHNIGLDHPNSDRKSVVYQCGYIVTEVLRDWQEGAKNLESTTSDPKKWWEYLAFWRLF